MTSKRHAYNVPTLTHSTTVYQSISNGQEEEFHKPQSSYSDVGDVNLYTAADPGPNSRLLINVKRDVNKPTIDDVLNYIGFGPVQVLAFVLSAITAMGFGFDMVMFAAINLPLQKQWNVSELEFAILPASTNVANLGGGLFYSLLSDG